MGSSNIHNSPPFVPNLGHTNPIHGLSCYSSWNPVLPPKLSSWKQGSLSLTFLTETRGPVSLPRVPHALPTWPHLIWSLVHYLARSTNHGTPHYITLASSRSTLHSNTLSRCLNVIRPRFNTYTLTTHKATFFNKHHTVKENNCLFQR